jgi:hypothetical protein
MDDMVISVSERVPIYVELFNVFGSDQVHVLFYLIRVSESMQSAQQKEEKEKGGKGRLTKDNKKKEKEKWEKGRLTKDNGAAVSWVTI